MHVAYRCICTFLLYLIIMNFSSLLHWPKSNMILECHLLINCAPYTVKKLSLGGNNDVITELVLPRGSLVSDIPAGDGKLVNLFLRCRHLQGWSAPRLGRLRPVLFQGRTGQLWTWRRPESWPHGEVVNPQNQHQESFFYNKQTPVFSNIKESSYNFAILFPVIL
jgi:hypothetical protein